MQRAACHGGTSRQPADYGRMTTCWLAANGTYNRTGTSCPQDPNGNDVLICKLLCVYDTSAAELLSAPEGPEAMEVGEPEPDDAAAAAQDAAAAGAAGVPVDAPATSDQPASAAAGAPQPSAATATAADGAQQPDVPAASNLPATAAADAPQPAAASPPAADAAQQLDAGQQDAPAAPDAMRICCAVARCVSATWLLPRVITHAAGCW